MFPTYEIHIVFEPQFFEDLMYALFFIGGGIVGFSIFSILKSNLRWKKEREIQNLREDAQ